MAEQTYLVAIDSSEEADEVMAAARQLADATGAKLACVTVVRPMLQVYGQPGMASYTQNVVDFEKQALAQAKERLHKLGGEYKVNDSDLHVRLGSPATEIRALASEMGCDLIVIGTHGRHGLGLILGSTASAVLHGIGCDAYVVRVRLS